MRLYQKYRLPLILLAIVIIISFVLVYFFMMNAQLTSSIDEQQSRKNTLLENATLTIPDLQPETTVKLTGQTTEFRAPDAPTDMPGGTATVVGQVVGDDPTMYGIVAVNTGGSGEFFYVVAFEKENGEFVSKGSTPLGDRIQIQNFSFLEPNTIQVSYLMHGPDQAMIDAPAVGVTDVYTYENGSFIHTSQSQNG